MNFTGTGRRQHGQTLGDSKGKGWGRMVGI